MSQGLDPEDVSETRTFSRTRKRGGGPSTDIRSCKIDIVYRPTGARVSGETASGVYTNAQMRAAEDGLRAELLKQLEQTIRQDKRR